MPEDFHSDIEEPSAFGDERATLSGADQVPPGDLKFTTNAEGQSSAPQERFEQVPVDSIQGVPALPDYSTETASLHPILARTPQGYFCLDGQGLIGEAREAGQQSIRCYVSDLSDHSEVELALRKAAVREKAPGGEPLYAERVRNVCRLFDILSQSQNVRRYGHGGDRRGESFRGQNSFDNVISVIADRLGKSTTTVNMLRSFGEHLDDATLERMIQEKVTKDFFEKVNFNKRTLLRYLEHEGKNQDEIGERISENMLEWLEEYKRTRKVGTVFPQRQDQEMDEQHDNEQSAGSNPSNNPESDPAAESFSHWSGGETEEPEVTFESLKKKAMTICEAFRTQLENPGLQLDRFCELATDQASQIMGIALKGRALSELPRSDKEDS